MIDTDLLLPDAGGLAAAVAALRAGGTVAFPTETVYGLGADARSDAAVAGIFAAKDRPRFNPLIVHVASLELMRELVEIPPEAAPFLPLLPGPLTLVLQRRVSAHISPLVTAGLDTLAVRIPAHPLARCLLAAFGGPLAAPSANPSGKVSPTTAQHVIKGLSGRITAVLDGGACAVGLESTIIGFDEQGWLLLRPGGMPIETLEAVSGQPMRRPAGTKLTAPGQLASHYAPDAALRLNADAPKPNEAWLGFGPNPIVPSGVEINLSPKGDMTEAAAALFAALRDIDARAKAAGLRCIAVAKIPQSGLGFAINDRLTRAAAPRDVPVEPRAG
ncbi:MAG: L-threonylcarbamoyladenylate synthase [Paracoccaceae bacterium]